MNIIQSYRQVESIIAANQSLIELELPNLRQESHIEDADVIQKEIEKKQTKDRLLCVGIVGRVKSGKSTLLNVLFFDGNNVLPKAATPMTAALTTLTYGEQIAAKIEFYSSDDIKQIKKDHDLYVQKFKQIVDEEIKLISKKQNSIKEKPVSVEENAKYKAKNILSREFKLDASYEQYEKIMKSKINRDDLNQSHSIYLSDFKELHENLMKYVGYNGDYMPFTKSVDIQLPLESLKEIKIVDSPGMNDPVKSREIRTISLLKECDAIFVIIPAGQFLSNNDLDMMDMITRKEGISELYVISSLVDDQLFGSEINRKAGSLPDVLKDITEKLARQMKKTLSNLKVKNEEVDTMFDQLIEQSDDRLILVSSICHTISNLFQKRECWDDSMQTVWNNLIDNYPDYFSENDSALSRASLLQISNISKIKEVLKSVRNKKDEILAKKLDEYIESKKRCLSDYLESLIKIADHQIKMIEEGDSATINEQKTALEKIEKIGSNTINDEYIELIESMEIEVESKLIGVIQSEFQKYRNEIDNAERQKIEEWTTGWWIWEKLHSREVTTVKAGAVRNFLENLITDIEYKISEESNKFYNEWRKKLSSELLKSLRSKIDDEYIDDYILRNAIKTIFNKTEKPKIEFDNELPEELNCSGTLEGESAEDFLSEARDYLTKTKKKCLKAIKKYGINLVTELRSIVPSDTLFSSIREQILNLEEQIRHRAASIDSYKRFIDKIRDLLNE